MVGGVLHLCGAFGGEMIPPDDIHPKGYFENKELYFYILEKLSSVFPQSLVQSFLRCCGYEGGPWFLKVPDVLFHWKEFYKIFPEAQWVIVKRDEDDVRQSWRRFVEKSPFNLEVGFIERFFPLMAEVEAGVAHSHVISSVEAVQDPSLVPFKGLVSWLGLEWNEGAVRAFLDKDLLNYPARQVGAKGFPLAVSSAPVSRSKASGGDQPPLQLDI